MNNDVRPPRSILHDARRGTRTDPKPRRRAAGEPTDRPSTDEDAAWLDRLVLALKAGLIVAEPRTALLLTEVLGAPFPRTTSTSAGQASEPRTTRDRRTDA